LNVETECSRYLDINSTRNMVYTTPYGEAWCGKAQELLKRLPDESVDLIVTSPPYALRRQKAYGNVADFEYIRWFRPFARQFHRVLKDTGSLVINIGGAWNEGSPTRSLYQYKLLLELCEPSFTRVNPPRFHLAQEFYWFNPAKIPNPAQWVTVERIRVKDATENIFWLTKRERPKASNKNVLVEYSDSMKRLIDSGKYNSGIRPSGWNVSEVWANDNGGAISPNFLHNGLNVIAESNTSSNDRFKKRCRELGLPLHPATFPKALPEFFIRFLTEKDDLVLDPFAGSNMTGWVAEHLFRRWLSIDLNREYVSTSEHRWKK
jgi:DNA modification methylase